MAKKVYASAGLIAVCVASVATMSSGQFVASAKTTAPLNLTIFDKNTGMPFNDPVAKEITKKTGVTLTIEQPTGNPTQKLSLMLASGDLPDIVLESQSDPNLPKFEANGDFIPLNDLIDKYGPAIKKQYGNVLNMTRYSDGKNYWLANWYGIYKDPVFGFQVRMDLMKQLPGVTASQLSGKTPLTAAQFEQLLLNFKSKYPTLDGKPTIPMTLPGNPTTGNMGAVLGTFKGMFGMKTYYTVNGHLKQDVEDPHYLKMLEYMNQLYRDGLIDPEWATLSTPQWTEKLASGQVFATTGAYWDVGAANTDLNGNNASSPKQFYAYKVVAPGVNPAKTTYGGRSSLGWDAISISKSDKDPVATIKFLNFLASPEGQYLELWGIQGKDWNYVKGVHTPKPFVVKGFETNWTNFSNSTGIRKWLYCVKNGYGTDGTAYDLPGEQLSSPVGDHAKLALGDSVWDTAPYSNLTPDAGSIAALDATKISNTENEMIPQIIDASSKAQAISLYQKMISQMQSEGLSTVDQTIDTQYQQRLTQWK